MRIVVHDYAGHAFIVQLSRQLAKLGHEVFHLYAGYNQTPRGRLTKRASDPDSLSIEALYIKRPLIKRSFVRRWFQEKEYGVLLATTVIRIDPDFVLSANTPLDAQLRLIRACKEHQIRIIGWIQDLLGIGTKKILSKKLFFLGWLIGNYYEYVETRIAKECDGLMVIAEDFNEVINKWDIDLSKSLVIHNWGPIDEITPGKKINPWSIKHDLADKFCFMYTGTLGMKHNPSVLIKLSEVFSSIPYVKIVVISEGLGMEFILDLINKRDLNNIVTLPFQPIEDYSDVLASADVLIAVLEEEAGKYSVPSKVLAYLCASRPLLLSVRQENLAARIVTSNNCGYCVSPLNIDDFIFHAKKLFDDGHLRISMGENGYRYAVKNFDIEEIASRVLSFSINQLG